MKSFTPRERLIKAKIKLQRESPFFAHLILGMTLTESNAIQSMAVKYDGTGYYNADWITTLNDSQVKGTLCHEVMHVALSHLGRLGNRQALIWNIACDMLINYMIIQEGFQLPKEGLIPKGSIYSISVGKDTLEVDVKDKIAEEIYDYLIAKFPKPECTCGANSDKKESDTQQDQGDSKDQKGSGCSSNSTDQKDSGSTPKQCTCSGIDSFDTHIYGDGELTEREQRDLEKEWKGKIADAVIASKEKYRGELPAHLQRVIDSLMNPKLPWKPLLYQYITKDIMYNYTYRKPGRRSYSHNMYMQ